MNSPVFTLLLISSFIPLWIEKILRMRLIFLDLLKIYFVVKHAKICVHLKVICILLVLGGMFCVCLLGQFGLNVVQVIHFFINPIYYLKWGIQISTIIVLLFISLFSVYIFRYSDVGDRKIEIFIKSSWSIDSFIFNVNVFFCLLWHFYLKSIFSEVNTTTFVHLLRGISSPVISLSVFVCL